MGSVGPFVTDSYRIRLQAALPSYALLSDPGSWQCTN